MRKLLVALGGLFLCLAANAQNVAIGSLTASGADCTTAGACVTLQFDSNDVASASIQLSGTFTATVQFEASSDKGTTWVAISGVPLNSSIAVTSATTANTWKFNVASITNIRARASAWTSAPTVIIRSSRGDPASVGGSSTAVTTGTAAVNALPGTPMICDSANLGTVTAAQAQMVRCNTAGVLATALSGFNADGGAAASEAGIIGGAGSAFRLAVSPYYQNLAGTMDRMRGDIKGLNVHGTSLGVTCQVAVSTATTLSAVGTNCAAPGAGLSIYITDIEFGSSAASGTAADSFPTLKSGTTGTCGTGTAVIWQALTAANTTQEVHLQTPIKVATNSEVCWIMTTAGSKTINISGYIAP